MFKIRRIRVLPTLLVDKNGRLVKTVRFGRRTYIGDPINAVKIFNDKGVDELILLDIDASTDQREPNLTLVEEIASEAFMPIGYGGGVTSTPQMKALYRAGVEKVILNSVLATNPNLISEAASVFGSQSVVVALDVKLSLFGKYNCYAQSGKKKLRQPVEWATECERLGAGELILTSIDRDGTYSGYDLRLISQVANAVKIPVVANGGARGPQDFVEAVVAGSSAVAASSIFIYAARNEGVLIRFPNESELTSKFWSKIGPEKTCQNAQISFRQQSIL